jgi:hypothetical protein
MCYGIYPDEIDKLLADGFSTDEIEAEYGEKNICGANIERIRKAQGMKQATLVSKMQLMGVDINPSSLSKLEGQTRSATDIELKVIAEILGVSIDELLQG